MNKMYINEEALKDTIEIFSKHNPRAANGFYIVHLLHLNYDIKTIAESTNTTVQNIYNIKRRYFPED